MLVQAHTPDFIKIKPPSEQTLLTSTHIPEHARILLAGMQENSIQGICYPMVQEVHPNSYIHFYTTARAVICFMTFYDAKLTF